MASRPKKSRASRPKKAHACRSKKCHHNNQKSHVCRSTKCHHKSRRVLTGRRAGNAFLRGGNAFLRGGNAFTDMFRSEPKEMKGMLVDIMDQSDDLQQKLHTFLSSLSEKIEKLRDEEGSDDDKRIMDDYYHRLGSHAQAGINELTKLNGHVPSMENINDSMHL